MIQTSILDAIEEAKAGLQIAVDHSNRLNEDWSDECYELFKEFIAIRGKGQTFMVEEFREYVKDDLPAPPSARAYGYVVVRGKKDNLIVSLGYRNKTSKGSHSTPAILWQIL